MDHTSATRVASAAYNSAATVFAESTKDVDLHFIDTRSLRRSIFVRTSVATAHPTNVTEDLCHHMSLCEVYPLGDYISQKLVVNCHEAMRCTIPLSHFYRGTKQKVRHHNCASDLFDFLLSQLLSC